MPASAGASNPFPASALADEQPVAPGVNGDAKGDSPRPTFGRCPAAAASVDEADANGAVKIGTVPWAADGFFHRLGEGSGGGIVDARAYSFFLTTYHKRSAEPDYLWYLDDAADSDGEVAWPELAQFPPRRLRPIGPGSP